jgi:hypothetical protein
MVNNLKAETEQILKAEDKSTTDKQDMKSTKHQIKMHKT